VHHADGVQAAFYDDPRVLTISMHEHPATLWPGTGLPSETGGPGAEGSAVNVALPAGCTAGPELPADDAVNRLRRLAQLRDSGVITEAEFQAKKDDLLTQI
jgi:acetoin utilization protein AcuC